jgi:hypothetical protein
MTNLGLRSDKNWKFGEETPPTNVCAEHMPGRLMQTDAAIIAPV